MAEKPSPSDLPALKFDGFFVLRTPLLPAETLERWASSLQAPTADSKPGALERALASDRESLRANLREQLERPAVREALFIASPSLDETLGQWLENPDSERGQKAERALVRYFLRMAHRPTPFGLFAGCAVGELGEMTNLWVPDATGLRRHTRLDMGYLFALGAALTKDPSVRAALRFRPNSSLYEARGQLRYAETHVEGRSRRFSLVMVEPSDHLNGTLQRAQDGATVEELSAALVAWDAEVSLEEARGFVGELLDAQLLVAELEPNVTGPESLQSFLDVLSGSQNSAPAALARETLQGVQEGLRALDVKGLGQPAAAYHAIATALESLPAKVELAQLFQVDLTKQGQVPTLGANVMREVERGIHLLHRFASVGETEAVRHFREKFLERYESRTVPLVEVLDDEAGIGFDSGSDASEASPLLVGLALGGGQPAAATLGAGHVHLLRRLVDAARNGALEVQLTEADVTSLKDGPEPPPELPDAMAVSATLLASSPEAVSRGEFRLRLTSVAGPSGANMLGRFVESDNALAARVAEHLRREEALQPDAVFAELVHLPEGRMGNILHRPVLRGYEIVYLGRSGAPEERRLPITDLLVRVVGRSIQLWSSRLDKQVIARLTNAHNHRLTSNPAFYRFLCQIQSGGQGVVLGWNWGPLATAPFLPRVAFGKLILEWARWRLSDTELKLLGAGSPADRYRQVQRLRLARNLPRHVQLTDGDNQLPLDLDNALCVETFCQLVKGRFEISLEEGEERLTQLCAHGPEGRFTHELLIPLTRAREPTRASSSQKAASGTPSLRTFHPGSEWLYLKLYTGSVTVDRLLREVVSPALEELAPRKAFKQWFFIRYGDPDWHLRLRFQGEPGALHADVLPTLQRHLLPWVTDGRLFRVQLDTYEREVERYGGDAGMQLSERLFHVDSVATLAIVQELSGDAGLNARWQLGLRGTDLWMDAFGLDLPKRLALMDRMAARFAGEFKMTGAAAQQLSDRYRKARGELEPLFNRSADTGHELQRGFEILAARNEQLKPITAELLAVEARAGLTTSLEALLESHIHMHLNRVLRSAQRAQEMVIYDFLARLYRSSQARQLKGM